ncbi:hypothetical protein Tco_0909597 [Tanacetum coccineum]|uniref:Uncharacterized protein n=1 Tax=Tanacetum coccineum TaxID=301880 RepID=A0ABQ5CS63_9ASTR
MNGDEDKYLDDILNLEAKVKTNENVVIKMSQSVQALFVLGLKSLSFYDPKMKHGLGYENTYMLKKAISQNPKLYDAYCFNNSKMHVNLNALYETFVPQKELSAEQKYFPSVSMTSGTSSNASTSSPPPATMPKSMICGVNDNSNDEIEKVKRESIDVQENLLKRIKILENDFQRCQKQCIEFELQLQHQKEKTKCENSLCKLLKRENVKLEYQKLFDSIKKTRTQTQGEIDELIEHVNQKTYAYADVRAQNQDLLITISELKAKLKNVEKYYYSEDQYAVSIKEDTAYPCLHSPKTTEDKAQYAVSRETQYAVFKIWNEYNILEDIKRGPYSKKSPIRLRMTKVIKGEFEKIKDVKVEDVSLTCDTSLEVFNNEVNRLSGMDDDLFTYEVEVDNW